MTDANNQQDRRVGYVGELGVKMPCRVAALVNIDLSAEQTINGVAVVENDYVLCTNQDDPTENGPYQVSTGDWNRAVWFNNQLAAVPGTLIVTVEGTDNNHTLWETVCADNPIDFGTSEIFFNFFSKAGAGVFLLSTNNLSDVQSASASRTHLGLQIGVDVQKYYANLEALGLLSSVTNLTTIAALASIANLTALAGLIGAASKIPYFTGAGTMSLYDLITVASKSDQETGTSLLTLVSPARQQSHASATKAWINFNGSSSTTRAAYNAAMTKVATGEYTITFGTAFSSANYCAVVSPKRSGSGSAGLSRVSAKTASAFTILTTDAAGDRLDCEEMDLCFYGAQ